MVTQRVQLWAGPADGAFLEVTEDTATAEYVDANGTVHVYARDRAYPLVFGYCDPVPVHESED